jgi:hypothetical protein
MKPVDESLQEAPPPDPAANDRGRRSAAAAEAYSPPAPRELQRSELVKGYEVDKGQYVTVTDEEIRNLRIESNGAIQIERFVSQAEIDRVYWTRPTTLCRTPIWQPSPTRSFERQCARAVR